MLRRAAIFWFAFGFILISDSVQANDGIILWSVDKSARIDIICDWTLKVRLKGRDHSVLPPLLPPLPTLGGYVIAYTADGSVPFEEQWRVVPGGVMTANSRQAEDFLARVLGRHILFVNVNRLTSFEFNLEQQADMDWKPLRPCLW